MTKQRNRLNSSANSRRRKKQEQEAAAAKKKKGGLRPIELTAIACFCIAGLLFALPKCEGETPSVPSANHEKNRVNNASRTPSDTVTTYTKGRISALRTSKPSYLYVIIDSFKLRKSPDIRDSIIAFLRIGQEVVDLGKRTNKQETFKIKQGLPPKTAPWVKVRTKGGKEGWVFAAGLEFYKSQNPMPTRNPISTDSTGNTNSVNFANEGRRQ